MESYSAFGDEEGFVVHFVPVGFRAFDSGWNDEFHGTEAVVLILNQRGDYCLAIDLPVWEPSSMMRMVIGPMGYVSPISAGTKATGTWGMGSPFGGFSRETMTGSSDDETLQLVIGAD